MKILCLVPSSSKVKVMHRDVLYGCWCSGNRVGGGILPPLTLLTVATILKEDGFNVTLIDMIAEEMGTEDIGDRAMDYDVVIILTSTMSFLDDVSVIGAIKDKNSEVKTILFGSHPSFMPNETLSHPEVDFIVMKEPFFAVRDLLRAMGSTKNFSDIPGIGYIDSGDVIINPDYPLIDYEDVPIADRDLLPKNDYFNPIIKKYPYTTTNTSYGCPGKCTFCIAPNMMGKKLRYWSADKVLTEIEYLLSLGIREIYYRDETFTTFSKRNRAICNAIIDKGLDFSWICNARVGTLKRDDLELMVKAGCRLIKVGVESGSQEVLDRSKKGIRTGEIEELFLWANEIGIDTHAHLMFGMPGETTNTIKETARFIKRIKPKTIDVGICTPYPGSVLFDELKKKNPDIGDGTWLDWENLHQVAHFNYLFTNVSGEDIEKAIRKLYRDFYLRPSYILRWLNEIKSPGELKRLILAGFRVIRYSLFG